MIKYTYVRPVWFAFHFAQYFFKNAFSTFFMGLGIALPAA